MLGKIMNHVITNLCKRLHWKQKVLLSLKEYFMSWIRSLTRFQKINKSEFLFSFIFPTSVFSSDRELENRKTSFRKKFSRSKNLKAEKEKLIYKCFCFSWVESERKNKKNKKNFFFEIFLSSQHLEIENKIIIKF